MFNLGFSEMLIIGVIALIVVGPKQLPELARQIARMLNEFKRATEEIHKTLKDTKSEAEVAIHKTRDEIIKHATEVVTQVKTETGIDQDKNPFGNKLADRPLVEPEVKKEPKDG